MKMVYRRACLIAAFLVLLVLSACGGGSSGSSPSRQTGTAPTGASGNTITTGAQAKIGIDPCSLLTDAQASQALGVQVSGSGGSVLPTCTYQDSSHQVFTSVGTSDDARAYYDAQKAQSSQSRDVSGIGDAAFSSLSLGAEGITVLAGKAVFSIAVTSETLDTAAGISTVEKLARDALAVVHATLPSLSAPQPDPCVLVTQSDVSRYLGNKPVLPLEGITSGGTPSCIYTPVALNDPLSFLAALGNGVFVAAANEGNASAARSSYVNSKPVGQSPGYQDIGGLGDAAFYDGIGSLTVLKGNMVLGVFVGSSSLPSNDAHVTADEQLARLALSRL